MPATGEFEPQLGEIRAVRTFRVGPGGLLFPLFSGRPWLDGDNDAACRVAHGADQPPTHVPPDPECTCGFYGYADLAGAGEYAYARHVLAVVSFWGRVIVATKGLRAQHARIDAIWLSGSVPADLARSVADRYPSTRVFADRHAMLDAYVPTALADYETSGPNSAFSWRLWSRLLTATALVAGVLPAHVIDQLPYGRPAWAAVAIGLLGVILIPPRQRHDAARQRRRLICVALLLWLMAPFAGAAGVVFLRLPLVQLALLISAQKLAITRMANTFPAEIV